MLAVTYIPFSKQNYDQVKDVLSAISMEDSSFKFQIRKQTSSSDYIAMIRSYSLDQAHKRGLLITKRYIREVTPKLIYWVREAKNWSSQIDLETQSLKVFEEPQCVALLVTLMSSKQMAIDEIDESLPKIDRPDLLRYLGRLREGEFIAMEGGKVVITERGQSLLARIGASS